MYPTSRLRPYGPSIHEISTKLNVLIDAFGNRKSVRRTTLFFSNKQMGWEVAGEVECDAWGSDRLRSETESVFVGCVDEDGLDEEAEFSNEFYDADHEMEDEDDL